MQVGVLDFADSSRDEPGSVCIYSALEYEIVVDKAFGPEGPAVIATVRETDMSLVAKDVVDNYLGVAGPATAANVQVRIEFDLVVLGKDVELADVE